MRLLIFAVAVLLSGCAHAKEYTWSQYELVKPDSKPDGPHYVATSSSLPMANVIGTCKYVWGYYAVKLVNEDTGEEHTFICDDVLKEQASQ